MFSFISLCTQLKRISFIIIFLTFHFILFSFSVKLLRFYLTFRFSRIDAHYSSFVIIIEKRRLRRREKRGTFTHLNDDLRIIYQISFLYKYLYFINLHHKTVSKRKWRRKEEEKIEKVFRTFFHSLILLAGIFFFFHRNSLGDIWNQIFLVFLFRYVFFTLDLDFFFKHLNFTFKTLSSHGPQIFQFLFSFS